MCCFGLVSAVFAEDPPAATGPSYVELEPSFTLNYGSSARLRYIQASITLRVRDSSAALDVTAHSDAIRHQIIMLFSRQSPEQIKSSAGRDNILDQALRELQDLMIKETGRPLIDRVLFTDFIVQS
ncbi:flagellar basal body-associated FliL family protein [Reinekea marina]|uniref:flagellar basal body-associated FliL family protein n=1 Tax=Reinekea marina TaxID=1310421 RepID=UPI0025B36D73|nr:flagellar basal body-associated FliL family protein [Reinekea marina]MDN3647723.1 flagellar basal body-associated FliL family protein [Reinekea marina]